MGACNNPRDTCPSDAEQFLRCATTKIPHKCDEDACLNDDLLKEHTVAAFIFNSLCISLGNYKPQP